MNGENRRRPGGTATNHTTVIHNSGDGNQFAVGDHASAPRAVVHGHPADTAALVRQLWDALPDLGLDEVDQADYVQAVSHIEEEANRDRPRQGRIRRALETVADLLSDRPVEAAQLALAAAGTLAQFYGLAAGG
ncbi:hypothetical protein HDA32_001888 [Spinactinospora alkalitolerans]|uniref:Uncharacterized protein n=1 Tax=Spinactinospora alkalitolerans TaxID=687207 RepID=A0A852TS40_9ACTN|nr:hypothetical protein [Spinactinospora alkalitolerans]NYE46768.1 hypothetical protein [Spinactinospora alkalitolerans]